MIESAGRCPLCGGDKELGTTTHAVDFGAGVVVVRDVPAYVCTQCGDAWIEDATAERLEQIVDAARTRHEPVEVSRWQDVA